MIEQIKKLEELRENLKIDSCIAQEPFMKLGEGSASTLDYNIPQKSTFSTYGHIALNIPENLFVEQTKQVPGYNFFALRPSDIVKRLNESVQLQTDDFGLNINTRRLYKNLNLSKTNIEDISLDRTYIAGEERPKIVVKETFFNEIQLKRLAEDGYMPIVVDKLNGIGSRIQLLRRPEQTSPRLFIIEEYKTSSFLGNYGAGKTLQTFSLLPGEKTTLTIRTYKDSTISKTQSENLLDSFSQDSVDEMERLMEEENSISKNSNSENLTNVSTSASSSIFKIVKVAASAKYSNHSSAIRVSNTRSLNRAISKHVEQSNIARNIEINTTSSDVLNTGEEMTTIREIENINKSKVLNFVFRQLLQEYITITYLSNIRIVYTNGYMESTRIANIEEMDDLLEDVIVPEALEDVRNNILNLYYMVRNYKGRMMQFLEKISNDYKEETFEYHEEYWTRKAVCEKYDNKIEVDGIILQVQTNVLKTDSVIVDTLMGQGEALDCFNQKVQDAISVRENLKNIELIQKIELIESLDDPQQKIEMYKHVFGKDLSNQPQTQIISNTTNKPS